jgi:hypothetical protein
VTCTVLDRASCILTRMYQRTACRWQRTTCRWREQLAVSEHTYPTQLFKACRPMSREQRSAFVLVNGLQMMECLLPSHSEGTCAVYANAYENLRVMDDYGRVEISCVFYASSDVTEEYRPWVATLTADEEEIALGQLPRAGGRTRVVCRYVREHPQKLKLTVTYQAGQTFSHPEEDELLNYIRLIMLNDELRCFEGGFVRLSHIQNKLESLDLYKRVVGAGRSVGHYNRSFGTFIAAHPEFLQLKQVPGGEASVALAPSVAKRTWTAEDCRRREQEDQRRDAAAVDELQRILDEGSLELPALLNRLREESAFCAILRPSSRNVVCFLEQHREQFWVTCDPVHTTRVGLRDH